MSILDNLSMFENRMLYAKELNEICDVLFEEDEICDRCNAILKANVYIALTEESNNVENAFDRKHKGIVNLHQSCITRLLMHLHSVLSILVEES